MTISGMVAALRVRAVEGVESAKAKVLTVRDGAVDRVSSTRAWVSETLNGAKQMAEAKVQEARQAVAVGQAFVIGQLEQPKAAVGARYQQLRSDGVRAWAAEASQAVRRRALTTGQGVWQGAATRYQAVRSSSRALAESVRGAVQANILEAQRRLVTARSQLHGEALHVAHTAKSKAVETYGKVQAAAKDGHVQATAAGMAGGAATLGATGGATGLAAGAAVGAALGVVPALFTFGLSIPIGAAIGGGTGCAVGAAVGAASGAVGGGAAGYGAYAKSNEIQQIGQSAKTRVSSGVDLVRGQAAASVHFVKDKATAMRMSLTKAKAA